MKNIFEEVEKIYADYEPKNTPVAFPICFDWLEILDLLKDEEASNFIKLVIRYADHIYNNEYFDYKSEALNNQVLTAFIIVKPTIDNNCLKYLKKCKLNYLNIKKRYEKAKKEELKEELKKLKEEEGEQK